MKRTITAIFLGICLTSNSFAFAPLAPWIVPAIQSAAVHIAVLGGAAWAWWNNSNRPSSVNTAGDITRRYDVTWIDTRDINSPKVATSPGTGKVNNADLKNAVLKDAASKAKYPNLAQALEKNNVSQLPTDKQGLDAMGVDKVYEVRPGNYYKVTNGQLYQISHGSGSPPTGYPRYEDGMIKFIMGGLNAPLINYMQPISSGNLVAQSGYWTVVAKYGGPGTPEQRPSTPQELVTALNMDQGMIEGEAVIFTDKYGAEIDDLIQSEPNIVHWDDDPIVTEPPSAQAINDALNGTSSGNSSPTELTPGSGGTGGSSGTSGSSLGNTGGTPGYVAPSAGGSPGSTQEGDTEDNPGSYRQSDIQAYGDNRPNDIPARFNQFLNDMKNQPLLNFASRAAGNIPSTGESSASFNGGRFGVHSFDYSTLSPVFHVLQKLFMILTVFTCVRIITKTR